MTQNPAAPPQAVEAEMAVLGSMLIEREAAETALDALHENDFYLDGHKRIFRTIYDLVNSSQVIDVVTVSEELRKRSQLDAIGGGAYLAELINKVTTAAHVEHYARIVKEKSLLRALIAAATNIVSGCYTQDKETKVLLDEAQSSILKVSELQTTHGVSDIKALVHEVLDRLEERSKNKNRVTGVPSGLRALDHITSGFQKSDLILIAARPAMGKTALALNIITHAVLEKNIPVLFFSLEMGRHSIMERFVASEAKIEMHDIRTGYYKTKSWPDITTALSRFSEAPLFINDNSSMTVMAARTIARQLTNQLRQNSSNKKKDLGLIVIDYLQLLRSGTRSENRQQEVSEISRSLKQLARELNVPVIALSQLSRASEDKSREGNRPKLSDLRESGSLEQDADVVAMIHRESYYNRKDPMAAEDKGAEIIIAKQRQGPTDTAKVLYLRQFTQFVDEATAADEAAPDRQSRFSEEAF